MCVLVTAFGLRTIASGHYIRNCAGEYIRNQREHHLQRTFREEFKAMLRKQGFNFDETH
jgi:hypothetical protein